MVSKLLAGIWFILYAVIGFGWAVISIKLMAVLALVIGILWVIEALGVYTVSVPSVRRRTVVEE